MDIKITNTATKQKELFVPIKKGEVKIYTCGPTVYHFAHLGNYRTYLTTDLLVRMFKFNNYKVTDVMNITDVGHLTSDADEGDDKMEKGAKRENKTVQEVAQFYTDAFVADLKALNIHMPKIMPKATEHVAQMIEIIKKLEKNGYTYKAGGNIYFDITKFSKYADLAGHDLSKDAQKEHSRTGLDENKKNFRDFALWFTKSKYSDQAQVWDSPWGRGYPGWHIECSAMSSKYLGEEFDIHLGGIDLIPTHHTNEIAQSDCAFGHKTVHYWMHTEFLALGDGIKMAKSSGDFLQIKSLAQKGYTPIEYRYFLLGTHYKKNIIFSWDAMEGAKNALKKLKDRIIELKKVKIISCEPKPYDTYIDDFILAINDDLNMPKALAILWKVLQDTTINDTTKLQLACKFDEVFGLGIEDFEDSAVPAEVQRLVDKREDARKNKDWTASDELRDEIDTLGYTVRDTPQGPVIKAK